MRILITGASGFIGFHLARRLLRDGHEVLGVDEMNAYYDPALKEGRESLLRKEFPSYRCLHFGVEDERRLEEAFREFRPEVCYHLAAQAGVRHSIEDPGSYVRSNLLGMYSVLERCRYHPVKALVYASSSSVYGLNSKVPYSVEDKTDRPVSLYAATKKAGEEMAYSYSRLYGIPMRGVRFFTVYGSWGRPDMAYFSFTEKILRGERIVLFNDGKMERDFTHVGDIVEGLVRMGEREVPKDEDGTPHWIYNLGNSHPVPLLEFVRTLEDVLGKKAEITLAPMQKGDVEKTFADVKETERDFGFLPRTPLKEGLLEFCSWYREWKGL